MNKKFRGYITSRRLKGSLIPQRVQNLVIRDFCQKQKAEFLLSATEYIMEHCYMMLDSLIQKNQTFDGIVFYSLQMLPTNKEARAAFFDRARINSLELHFALEELSIKSATEIQLIEDIILTETLAAKDVYL